MKTGPQKEVLEFIVDTGAERTCVVDIPGGCDVCSDTVERGEEIKVPVIKSVIVGSEIKVWRGDILLGPRIGNNLLGGIFRYC